MPQASFPLPEQRETSPDWTGVAQLAAAGLVATQALARQRRKASGEMPWADPDAPAHPYPAFPWSRQPLTSWFDFDVATLTSSMHIGKHCEVVFVLILPAFGCLLGHIDADPVAVNLLDPSFQPPPLELPPPALPLPAESWSVPAGPGSNASSAP